MEFASPAHHPRPDRVVGEALVKDTSVVDRLAQIIRTADGNHDMGAAALADAIVDSGFLFDLETSAYDRGYEAGYDDGYDARGSLV